MENKYPFSGVKGRAKKNPGMAGLRGLMAFSGDFKVRPRS
jgi:hypothetical protein